MNHQLEKLPEQDSNLRPPVVNGLVAGGESRSLPARGSGFGPDSQADGAKSGPEVATKAESMLGSCEICGRYRVLHWLGRGEYVVWICDECEDEDRDS